MSHDDQIWHHQPYDQIAWLLRINFFFFLKFIINIFEVERLRKEQRWFILPGLKRRLVVMGISKVDMLSDLHRHCGSVFLLEPLPQRRRCRLRRRGSAAGGHKLVRRRNDGAAEHTQHFTPLNCLFPFSTHSPESSYGIRWEEGARVHWFYRGSRKGSLVI